MIKPVDVLCQQIGGINRAGFAALARSLLIICWQNVSTGSVESKLNADINYYGFAVVEFTANLLANY